MSKDTKVKFVEVGSTSTSEKTGYALCVTQANNGVCTNDYLVAYNKNIDDSGRTVYEVVSPADGGYSGSLGLYSSYDIVIHYSVSWSFYPSSTGGVYVRPTGLTWSYEKKDNSVNVTYVWVKYVTSGALCTYPGFSFIEEGYKHNMIKSVSNPSVNTNYSASNALPPARCIDLSGMAGGMAITSTFTVDGYTVEDEGAIILGGF